MKIVKIFVILVILFTAVYSVNAQNITWTKFLKPSPCLDNSGSPCYWPNAQGFLSIIPNIVDNSVIVYSTRQDFNGTVTVTGGTSVTWVSGDKFGLGWGLVSGDIITINGVSKTITAGSVTATSLTLTTAAANGTFTYSVSMSGLTASTDFYNYFPLTHTFSAPYVGANSPQTNLSMATETDIGGTWPADRQQTGAMVYDTNRSQVWLVGGVSGGRSWNSTSNPTTTWQLPISTKIWNGAVTAHHPVNSSILESAVFDPDDNLIFMMGNDGGPGFRTSIYCATSLNSSPGIKTANQTTAGCNLADDWNTVTTSGVSMPNIGWPGVAWANHKIYLFGGSVGSTANSTIYSYTPLTKVWAVVGASCSLPVPPSVTQSFFPAWTVLSTGNLFYHSFAASPSDYIYNPLTDSCTTLNNSGGGPIPDGGTWNSAIAVDPGTGRVVAWPQGGHDYVWEGEFTSNSSSVLSGNVTLSGSATLLR